MMIFTRSSRTSPRASCQESGHLRTRLIHLCLERQRSGAQHHRAAHSLSLGCWRQGPLTGLLALITEYSQHGIRVILRSKAVCLGCALWCRNVWAWALHHKAVLLRLSWREFSVKIYIYIYIYLFIYLFIYLYPVYVFVSVHMCVYIWLYHDPVTGEFESSGSRNQFSKSS